MLNLSRFKNYEEFKKYYESTRTLLEELTIEVDEIEDYINFNDGYLVEPTKEKLEELNAALESGKINIFKYHDDLNYEKLEYVRHLLECFSYSLLHLTYSELVCDSIRMRKIIDRGAKKFNRDIKSNISKGYIFERITNSTELLSYFDGIQKEKEIFEQEIENMEEFLGNTDWYSHYSKINGGELLMPAEHYEVFQGPNDYLKGEDDLDILSEEYREYLQEEYLESQDYLAIKASLLSIEYEIRELSKIVDMIKSFKENAETESRYKTIVETDVYDQTITSMADGIYKQYRAMMINRYLAKQSKEAYSMIYDQETETTAMACETMQRVLEKKSDNIRRVL